MSMRKIYRKIAKEHGVTVKEVRQDMQAAITEAYTNPLNNNEVTRAYQRRVQSNGTIPTPEEVISHAVQQIKKQGTDA